MWKFIPSDKFELSQLQEWLKFYRQDLRYSEDYLDYVKKNIKLMRNMKNSRSILSIAEEDVRHSKWNLDCVIQAIKKAGG